jgi:asparagine synthase (glutamine-hydrolysing)
MLDGQGSDEQLAGYAGNDAALYAGQLRRWELARFAGEVVAYRGRHGRLPLAQMIFAARNVAPWLDVVLPGRLRLAPPNPEWLCLEAPSHLAPEAPRDLSESLRQQTLVHSLPVLLRYEDRNSMARSIESRVPFLDYRLVEFLAGLPDALKLRHGRTKVVLRDGLRNILPPMVAARRDKMGFVTPEEVWLRETASDWFRGNIEAAIAVTPDFYDAARVRVVLEDMIAGRVPFSFLPWRILCLGRWMAAVQSGSVPSASAAVVHVGR